MPELPPPGLVELPSLHDVEAEFIRHTATKQPAIAGADAEHDDDPDGRYLVLWWDGTRVWRWQGDDREEWKATWRLWSYCHAAITGADPDELGEPW